VLPKIVCPATGSRGTRTVMSVLLDPKTTTRPMGEKL
jgi:hypothetical protein